MAKSAGVVFELFNNYGSINSDSFKQGEETIPFEITSDMIAEKDGSEFIRYTHEVMFDLRRTDNVRDKQIKEAVNVEFTGSEWLYQKRIPKRAMRRMLPPFSKSTASLTHTLRICLASVAI